MADGMLLQEQQQESKRLAATEAQLRHRLEELEPLEGVKEALTRERRRHRSALQAAERAFGNASKALAALGGKWEACSGLSSREQVRALGEAFHQAVLQLEAEATSGSGRGAPRRSSREGQDGEEEVDVVGAAQCLPESFYSFLHGLRVRHSLSHCCNSLLPAMPLI